MQLVAYGAQDIYLTGNPQITFFKVVYRRHTNFSMESIKQTFDGTVGFGNRVTATISRNGDLVHRMYLEATVTGATGRVGGKGPNFGSALISDVELEIGGQKIDKHTGAWLETWAELTEPNSSALCALQTVDNGTGAAVGSGTNFQNMSMMGGVTGAANVQNIPKVYIPLQFWFCRNPGLALPLIALQYHEVKTIVNISSQVAAMGTGYNDGALALNLFCDYIYLDTDERRRFAQVSHEYLIEQLQFEEKTGGTMDLNFNHPVKELIWIGTPTTSANSASLGTSTPGPVGTTTYQLKLNGHDRFSARTYTYFTKAQLYQHHSGAGGLVPAVGIGRGGDTIAVYSFALKPEEHQPSGTCNFSRIDNAQLIGNATAITVFAVNYNVLRIMSGMGGLAYSN